jgi:hypothetical protein
MHSLLMLIAGSTAPPILAAESARAAPRTQSDLVEFEKMTWVEVKAALEAIARELGNAMYPISTPSTAPISAWRDRSAMPTSI